MDGWEIVFPEARVLEHVERRPRFSKCSEWGVCPDDPSDARFVLAEDERNEAVLPGYLTEELVCREEDFVFIRTGFGEERVHLVIELSWFWDRNGTTSSTRVWLE